MAVNQKKVKIANSVRQLEAALENRKNIVGLVPTMGALHAGHMSLVRKAKSECDTVAVSVFVNPTQFNDKNDLANYPRTLEADCKKLQAEGCDIVFAPSVTEIYPEGWKRPEYDLGGLDKVMEGVCRPGHFAGVTEVVGRLFDLVAPERAYFGEKDFQQLAIVRRMESLRGNKVQIVSCPIVRGNDGLALSSRNALLSADSRRVAPNIYKTLLKMTEMDMGARELEEWGEKELSRWFKVEYVRIVDKITLQQCDRFDSRAQACVAAWAGNIRLIDNMSGK